MSACRRCGTSFEPGTLFCASCGSFLAFDAPTPDVAADELERAGPPEPPEQLASPTEDDIALLPEVVPDPTPDPAPDPEPVAVSVDALPPAFPSLPAIALPQLDLAGWAAAVPEQPQTVQPPALPVLPLPPFPLADPSPTVPPPPSAPLAFVEPPLVQPPLVQPPLVQPPPLPTVPLLPPSRAQPAPTAPTFAVDPSPVDRSSSNAAAAHGRVGKASSALCLTALDAVSKVLVGAAHFQRDDLVDRLRDAERRLRQPELAVVVVGEFKKGKSSLVNALSGFDLCPTDEVVATSVATIVRYGPRLLARVNLRPGEDPAAAAQHVDIRVQDVSSYISEGDGTLSANVTSVELEVPSALLESGLALIDTPGVGGLDSAAAQAALTALNLAEAVIFVTDATQEITAPELDYLLRVRDRCPNVLCVMTKIDMFGEWRRIAEIDRGHLQQRGLAVPIIPVSCTLQALGVATADSELLTESGFESLQSHLLEYVIRPADSLAARAAARDVLYVLDQLAGQISGEIEAFADPSRVGKLRAQFEQARQAAGQLRQQSARWQVTLGDGMADLNAGVDNDVARRIRAILSEGEQALEANDPTEIWDEFETWIRRRVVDVAVDNDAYLQERTAELVKTVVEHFMVPGLSHLDPADLTRLALADIQRSTPADQLTAETTLAGLRQRGVANMLTATRTGFAGTSIIAGIFRLASAAPLAGAAGLALGVAGAAAGIVAVASVGIGRKVLGDLRKGDLTQRRQKASLVFRRYVDEASFVLVKDAREALRVTQRSLRDRFAAFASELEAAANSAVVAADAARKGGEAASSTRVPELQGQLQRILEVRVEVAAMAAAE